MDTGQKPKVYSIALFGAYQRKNILYMLKLFSGGLRLNRAVSQNDLHHKLGAFLHGFQKRFPAGGDCGFSVKCVDAQKRLGCGQIRCGFGQTHGFFMLTNVFIKLRQLCYCLLTQFAVLNGLQQLFI